MLLLTRESRRWRRGSYLFGGLLIGTYVYFASTDRMYGGSPIGLAYGTLALGLTLVLMYFGVRKRSYKSSWGTVEGWLQAHIYVGLLAVAVVLLHAGFQFQNIVAVAAFALLMLVTLSGIWGAVLYTVIPPRMSSEKNRLELNEMAEQMNELGHSMARLAAGKSHSFQKICARLLKAEKPGPLAGWRSLLRRHLERRLARDPAGAFDRYVGSVPSDEHADLTQLLALAHQRNDLHDSLIRHQRHINLLAVWLYFHVPFSFAFLILTLAHVIGFFYYG